MRIGQLCIGLLVLGMCACQSRGEIVDYWVDSSRVPCTGVGPRECMQVKRGGDLTAGNWQPFYDSFQGFDYVPGKVYHLRVRETKRSAADTPADASTTVYTLVEVLETREEATTALAGNWVLEQLGADTLDAFALVPLQQPTLELRMKQQQVRGLDGCNRFWGELVSAGAGTLAFGELASTRMACPTKSKLPQRILEALGSVRSYRMEGNRLRLLDGAGEELLAYRRVD